MDTESTAPAAESAAAAAPAQTDFEKWAKLPEEEQNAVAGAKPEAKPEASEETEGSPAAGKTDSEEIPEAEVPKGLQKRFRELTTKIKNLENEAAAARAKATANPAAPGAAPAAAPAPEGKPEISKFETYEAYLEALTKWTVKETQRQSAQEAATQRAQASARERNAAWQKELEGARERHADFDAVALTDLPINRATHNAIVEGGRDGAELAYYLGQHKEEAAEIFKLTPVATVLALGKIMAKFEAPAAAAAPAAISRAPKPATPIAARGSAADKEPDPSDFPKWQAWQRRREAAEEAA